MRQSVRVFLRELCGLSVVVLCLPQSASAQVDDPRTVFPAGPAAVTSHRAEPALQLDLSLELATDFVFRGTELPEPAGQEDALHHTADAKLTFNSLTMTGATTVRPFLGLLIDLADDENRSAFQRAWPSAGLIFETEDLGRLELGHTTFIYPDRSRLNTNELYLRAEPTPLRADVGGLGTVLLRPGVLLAWDYDAYDGVYAEATLAADRPFETIGLTLGLDATLAAATGLAERYGTDAGGAAFYELGVRGDYQLNTLLNIPRGRGDWSAYARLAYTDGLDGRFDVESQLWGVVGLSLAY